MEQTPTWSGAKTGATGNVVIAAWAVGLILGLCVATRPFWPVLAVFAFALMVALVLGPVVNYLESQGLSRLVAVTALCAGILILGLVGLWFFGSIVSDQAQELSMSVAAGAPGQRVRNLSSGVSGWIPFWGTQFVQTGLESQANRFLTRTVSTLQIILAGVIPVSISIVVAAFLLKDGDRMKRLLFAGLPNRYLEIAYHTTHNLSTRLRQYLQRELIRALAVAALAAAALYLLNIRYYFLIGLLAGVASTVPRVGLIIGATPAAMIAFGDAGSWGAVATVAVAFASVHLIETMLLSHFIGQADAPFHPLTFLAAILIGGQAIGLLGVALAFPIFCIIRIVIEEVAWAVRQYRIF